MLVTARRETAGAETDSDGDHAPSAAFKALRVSIWIGLLGAVFGQTTWVSISSRRLLKWCES